MNEYDQFFGKISETGDCDSDIARLLNSDKVKEKRTADNAVRFSFSLSAPLYRGRIHHPENRSFLRANRKELQIAGHKLLCFQSSFGCLDGICSFPLIQGSS